MFHWEEKYPVRDMGNGKVRTAGVAMAMQGSCISHVDVGSATIKLGEDGTYNLIIGAADMGTGCDTILAQMAAECLDCSVDDIAVFGADTDASPYDYFQHSKGHLCRSEHGHGFIHPETSELLTRWLLLLKEQGEDAAFRQIRQELRTLRRS